MKKTWIINPTLSIILGLVLAIILFFIFKSVLAWTNPTQAPPGGSGILPAGYVTSLPSSPVDGQEVYYIVDSSNAIVWHLRYNSGSGSTYKWEFLGGTPYIGNQGGGTVTNGTPANLGGPSFTLPRGGDYEIEFGFYAGYNGGNPGCGSAGGQLRVGGSVISTLGGVVRSGAQGQPSFERRDSTSLRRNGATASQVVDTRFYFNVGNCNESGESAGISDIWLRVIPIRIN